MRESTWRIANTTQRTTPALISLIAVGAAMWHVLKNGVFSVKKFSGIFLVTLRAGYIIQSESEDKHLEDGTYKALVVDGSSAVEIFGVLQIGFEPRKSWDVMRKSYRTRD